MEKNYNASATEMGFHYQDVAAMYFFISSIKDIKSINVEGEEDFELFFKNDSLAFYQVKAVQNPDNPLKAIKIKDTLRVLSNDIVNNCKNKILEIGLVTNSNYPFGRKYESSFQLPYMKKSYKSLTESAQKKILKQLNNLKKGQISCLLNDNDLSKFFITKLSYDGEDQDSKLSQFYIKAHEVLGTARIDSRYDSSIFNEWFSLFRENSEKPDEKISTKIFTAHTEVAILNQANLESFFDKFNIEPTNETYILDQYSTHLQMLALDIEIQSKIKKDYRQYREQQKDVKSKKLIYDFVNKEASDILEKIGLTKKDEDLDISKLIIWLVVTQNIILNHIEEAFGYED